MRCGVLELLRRQSQVDALHRFVLRKGSSWTIEHGAAGLQDVGVLGNLQSQFDGLFRQQQR